MKVLASNKVVLLPMRYHECNVAILLDIIHHTLLELDTRARISTQFGLAVWVAIGMDAQDP